MNNNKSRRQTAIIKRRIFLVCCGLILTAAIVLVVFAVKSITDAADGKKNKSSDPIPVSSDSSGTSSQAVSDSSVDTASEPEYVQYGDVTLNASYTNLMLVNDKNPLPADFDYEGHLTTIEDKYINGSLKQIDAEVYPYMKAMIEAAWADNVKLYVWSPYRSYATQDMLFKNKIQRLIASGTPESEAEAKAATVVARPGTSEHNTGLAADFNMASSKFETTPMYTWMQEHAADYGFIMRYSQEKTAITGVIYESWHYRFVGINAAKEMKSLNMCLEEYVKYLADK